MPYGNILGNNCSEMYVLSDEQSPVVSCIRRQTYLKRQTALKCHRLRSTPKQNLKKSNLGVSSKTRLPYLYLRNLN